MKKIIKYVSIFLFIIILCSCGKKEEEQNNKLSLNEEIGVKGEFYIYLNDYLQKYKKDYHMTMETKEMNGFYGEEYLLYNSKNNTTISTFVIYFENKENTSKIVNVLYSFPLNKKENEDNLKVEYELYKALLNSILSKSTDKTLEKVHNYFSTNSFNDFKDIYNEKITYNYKNIDMNDKYISMLYIKQDKTFTFEYYNSIFVNEEY